jgi:hypothetical protein
VWNPLASGPKPETPKTPREELLDLLADGVPSDLACAATGLEWDTVKGDPDAVKAKARGDIATFKQVRDGANAGAIRASARAETGSWLEKEPVRRMGKSEAYAQAMHALVALVGGRPAESR